MRFSLRDPLARIVGDVEPLARRVFTFAFRHALIVPILLLAAWLRLMGLAQHHLYGDEAEYAIVARDLARDPLDLRYPSLSGSSWNPFVSQPPLALYLMGAAMRALGPTDLAAQLPSALLGIATVAVVYALGARLGGRLMATTSAALLAILPFHVSMSRDAMLDVPYVFFLVLTAYFVVAWLQDGHARQIVAAGVAAAACALTKLPGALAVVLVAGVLAIVLVRVVIARARGRGHAAEVARVVHHATLAAAPVVVGLVAYVALLWHIGALDALTAKLEWQFSRVAGDGGSSSSKPISYYFTDKFASFEAQLGSGVFALALVGLAFCGARVALGRGRALDQLVLPLLVAILAAFFFGSSRKIGFYLLPFAPLAALLVGATAAGVRDLVVWAGIHFTRADTRRAAPVAVLMGLLAVASPAYAVAGDTYEDYFDGPQPRVWGYGFREAGAWIHEQDPDAAQLGTLLGRFTLRWYNEHVTFHSFVDRNATDRAILDGQLRFIVHDKYLALESDEALIADLVSKYHGRLAVTFEREWGRVDVIELRPHYVPWHDDCNRKLAYVGC